MKKTIMITGVSGFIGSAVAQRMLYEGHKVIGIYNRNPARIDDKLLKNFIPYQCKLDKADEVKILFENMKTFTIDAIIHIAGLALDWGPYHIFHAANVESTRNLIHQAIVENIPVFINTSTMAVHGFGIHHVESTELGPYSQLITPYQKTKLEAENIVKSLSQQIKTVTLRPGNVYGPGDTTTLYPILEAIRSKKMGTIDNGQWLTNPVFIDDMVESYCLALTILSSEHFDQINGESINITNSERVTWKEYLSSICTSANLPEPTLNVPACIAHFLATILMSVYWLLRIKSPPALTYYRVQQTSHHYNFSIEKAKGLLGYRPKKNIREGIEISVAVWKNSKLS